MVEQVATIRAMRQALAGYAALLDPAVLLAADCQAVMKEAAVIEKIASTIVALTAARVAETDLWRRSGDRSPAAALARETGQSLGRAKEQLETGARLPSQPDVEAAARSGQLSADEAAAISDAAAAAPGKERELIDKAKNSSLKELRDECQKIKANADPDPEATRRRIHRERSIRSYIDREGAWNLHARGLPENGAEFMAALQPPWDSIFTRARSNDVTEPSEAYGFDALIELARWAHANQNRPTPTAATPDATTPAPEAPPSRRHTDSETSTPTEPTDAPASEEARRRPHPLWPEGSLPHTERRPPAQPPPTQPQPQPQPQAPSRVQAPTIPARPPAKIIARVDLEAVLRGRAVNGETCDILGFGPVSVSAIRDLMDGNPFIAAVITKGRQVLGVAHLGRGANAHQITALQWSMPECTAEGCPVSGHLENDHREEFSRRRETELSNLDPVCNHHHDLKTHHGWAFVEGIGKRAMVPPDDPRHPRWSTPHEEEVA